MLMIDIKEGATNKISGKCYVSPRTKLTGASIAGGGAIEIECEEVPECPKGKTCEPFDVEAEIVYEPYYK